MITLISVELSVAKLCYRFCVHYEWAICIHIICELTIDIIAFLEMALSNFIDIHESILSYLMFEIKIIKFQIILNCFIYIKYSKTIIKKKLRW